ncbi:MAG: hypothetical protein Q9163_001134 [Psora crenata]
MVSHTGCSSDDEEDILNQEDEEGWDDVEPDLERLEFQCLFDNNLFADVASMLQHCRETHNFDLGKLYKDLRLEYIEMIKLVNYIRSQTLAGMRPPDISTKSVFEDDQYLKPVLEDDPLLYSLEDALSSDGFDGQQVASTAASFHINDLQALKPEEVVAKLRIYEQELATARQALEASAKQLHLTETALQQANSCADFLRQQLEASPETDVNKRPIDRTEYWENNDCYSGITIHRQMLQDKIRTESYQKFILDNKHLLEGKTVLDVGCGTGILSMFCAQAGAKKIYAVEQSTIYQKAQKIVFDNGFQETIKVLHGRVQDISLPVAKVDVIVSEWMGYCLLYEGMLDSVIWARDRYLAPGGLMIPALTTLRIAPMSNSEYSQTHVGFWKSVYGFDMLAMSEGIERNIDMDIVPAENICGSPDTFNSLSMYTATVKDLTFATAEFKCTIDEGAPNGIDGLVIWFDTYFSTSPGFCMDRDIPLPSALTEREKGSVAFTTGPFGEATHWTQGVLLFDRRNQGPNQVKARQTMTGSVGFKKGVAPGGLEVHITWRLHDEEVAKSQTWVLD